MRKLLLILLIAFLSACNSSDQLKNDKFLKDSLFIIAKNTSIDSTSKQVIDDRKKIAVIILPSYDQNANGDISPYVTKAIYKLLRADSSFNVIDFPYKILHDYYNIYDKKYCTEIIQKVNPDIIIMSKIDFPLQRNGVYNNWDIEIKAYCPKKDTVFKIYSKKNITDAAFAEKDVEHKLDINKLKCINF